MVTSPMRSKQHGSANIPSEAPAQRSPSEDALDGLTPLSFSETPLFGTDGIRGKVGEVLNAPLARQAGYWAARSLQKVAARSGPVILGQDSRNSSEMLATALTAGLTAAGLEVWNVGLCPTPCVSYLTGKSEAIGGIMISASHNPPEDNGIKFFGETGTKLAERWTQEIEAGMRGNRETPVTSTPGGRSYSRPELAREYATALQRSLPEDLDFQNLRIVLDLAWGAAVNLAPAAFESLGADIIRLHELPCGDRINVGCGSTHLEPLQAAVREGNADLGFAFDGDADRVLAVDGTGRVIDGDYILYFWGKTLKARGQLPQNLIIATVMANLGFERAWQHLGGQLRRTAVGDQYVQAEMLNVGAMLGGEQSGHILCHHHSYSGDGLQTALHLTALVRQSGNSLAELVECSFQRYPQLLCNVRVEDRDRRRCWQDCEPLMRAIATAEEAMGDTGRILVRASGTEPLIRVMVEAETPQTATHWSEQTVLAVQKYLLR
ncbi:MAG: phosphoglucosamine mutase [Cyanobacteriota bacterium]|nr:phosphoglucosamine mutase [Cyanobacteriota bacterium]